MWKREKERGEQALSCVGRTNKPIKKEKILGNGGKLAVNMDKCPTSPSLILERLPRELMGPAQSSGFCTVNIEYSQ